MASRDTVVAAWYEANVAGKHFESARSSTYWGRGKFVFHEDTPIARIEQATDGSWHMFNRREGQYYLYVQTGSEPFVSPHDKKTYKRAIYLNRFAVHDIGLHTPFEAEQPLDGEAWHRLMLWQLEQEHLDFLRIAEKTSVKSYADYPTQGPSHVEHAQRAAGEHWNYRKLFCLHLPAMVDRSSEVKAVIDSKINKYMDPKRVEQRERAKARKLLVEALDLNGED